jgi:hypothetical protein
MSTPPVPTAPASPEVTEIERALTRITYLSTRARQHDRLMALAGVPLDRAAVALLRQVADSDRRAQRIELTEAGRNAVASVRDAGARGMQLALSEWSTDELQQLATLFHRMVDDFLNYAIDEEGEPEVAAPAGTA